MNLAPPDGDFDAAVRIAQAIYDQIHPDTVVSSTRGDAVARNIDSGATPLVLLYPGSKTWCKAVTANADYS